MTATVVPEQQADVQAQNCCLLPGDLMNLAEIYPR